MNVAMLQIEGKFWLVFIRFYTEEAFGYNLFPLQIYLYPYLWRLKIVFQPYPDLFHRLDGLLYTGKKFS